jgi:hypothetical protein
MKASEKFGAAALVVRLYGVEDDSSQALKGRRDDLIFVMIQPKRELFALWLVQ